MDRNNYIFATCQKINDLIFAEEEKKTIQARTELIKLLGFCKNESIEYTTLINHLIRQLGIYPYIQTQTAHWQDRFVSEIFKVDVGDDKLKTLHSEQSAILKRLLNNENLTVIAPTSFGKSFIIDAFIAIKKPHNIMIIVPTIALTDETRRRLQKKFSRNYKVITASEITLGKKNIFIFPQERALHYVNSIDSLDMLVIDEFYKASAKFDLERSTPLLNVILQLGKKAKQKYFIAPHITNIKDNLFMQDMEEPILSDFNTVYLKKHKIYLEINKKNNKEDSKKEELLKILNNTQDETLIYAGSHPQINNIAQFLVEKIDDKNNSILNQFSEWLATNYSSSWYLVNLVKKGIGIHNGRLHRSLSQIQIKLFSKEEGITNLISTSSIIEGVNTSAKNIVVWKNKIGTKRLNSFSYQNLIGRGGRMFKHFIGEIYLLEPPPEDNSQQIELSLEMPKELVDEAPTINEDNTLQREVKDFHTKMIGKLGNDSYNKLKNQGVFQENNWIHIEALIDDMKRYPGSWDSLNYLSSDDENNWKRHLYKVLHLVIIVRPPKDLLKFVTFIQVASGNWNSSIPVLVNRLRIDVPKYFEWEKSMSFSVSNLFNLVNILQKEIFPKKNWDISSFVSKTHYAFLPKNVYLLEEYGLPRMISKKIQQSGIIDLENNNLELNSVIELLKDHESVISNVSTLDDFDCYLLGYFFDGIKS